MEQSNTSWFSNSVMEMSGNIIDQWGLDSLDHLLTWEDIQDYSLLASNTITAAGSPMEYCSAPAQRPRKITKSSSWDSSCTEDLKPIIMAPSASSATILSFGNPDSPSCDQSRLYETLKADGRKRSYGAMVAHEVKKKKKASVAATTRPPSHNQDHVLAERKRRENLTRKFIALSAIVPGLKKMDKASVLGDAIKHLKQLQEKVKNLEDQAAKRAADSAVIVKKTQIISSAEDCNSCCDENFEDHDERQLPEIEVRLSEKSVLVKIHSDNRKGLLVRALSEVEKLNLTVISTSAVPFAASSLDITVMAQIEEGFSTTVKDIVKNLNSSLRELI